MLSSMQVYFSHSYRDVEINTYFFGILVEQELELFADQKSPTWCVAKLERYLHDLSGFLSIVPRRAAEDGSISYSPYIGFELSLARRSGLPRLIFVDDELLTSYRARFPPDVIPFVRSSPASDRFRHVDAIREFSKALESTGRNHKRRYRDRSVTVIAAGGPALSQATDALMDVLRSKAYEPRQITSKQLPDALDDVRLLEFILNSEMCVFLLDQQVTYADVLLAIAYAHCVPSIRLQYDPAAAKVEAAAESGRIRWSSSDDVLLAFRDQVDSYRMGFVQAISTQDVRNIAITHRTPRPEQLWDLNDGAALIEHIDPSSAHAREIVNAVRKLTGGSFVNADPLEVCTLLYRFIRTQHFAYEHEPPTLVAGRQAIRTADDIWNDNAATCLDLACLFASLLKAAGLNPIIVILVRPNFSHALVGYKAPAAPRWQRRPDLGDIRGSVVTMDVILFEPTGVVEHETAIGGELAQERRDGNRTLEFEIAKIAAERLINTQIELRYVLEVP
jgi:hypothetical protein